jgi:branched-chain amino acid transport system ATP-binding protein
VFGPDYGQILFDQHRIDGLRPDQVCAAGIGRTFQIVKPFAGLSVLDNAVVGALHRARGVRDARRHAEQVLDRLGLGAKRNLPVAALTLPDRKRLEVARAVATQPKLLLLDEVLAGLRPTECNEMIGLIRDMNQNQGMTIILIEHVMQAVMALAEQIIVLDHGEVIARGAPTAVVRDPAVVECYLGEDQEL